MNIKLIGVALVAIVIAIGGYMFPNVQPSLGVIAGPDSVYDYQSVNGVATYYNSSGTNQATTTVCSLRSPAATSTLTFGSVQLSVSTTSAYIITMAKGATPNASTTLLGNRVAYAAGVPSTQVATSTAANANAQDYVFAPSQYLNISMAGGIGTHSPTGTCKAQFVVN